MSTDDPDLPVHAISRVEDRERLLAEALAHVEELEEQYKVIPADPTPRGRWKVPVALTLLGLAVILALAPPSWLAGTPDAVPTESQWERGLRAAMLLQAVQVEAFRAREGRLPAHLSELPSPLPGLSLVRSSPRVYQIIGRRPDGSTVIYDSARPSPAFEAAAPWLEGGR